MSNHDSYSDSCVRVKARAVETKSPLKLAPEGAFVDI